MKLETAKYCFVFVACTKYWLTVLQNVHEPFNNKFVGDLFHEPDCFNFNVPENIVPHIVQSL